MKERYEIVDKGNALFDNKTQNYYIRIIPDAMHSLGDTLSQLKNGKCTIIHNKEYDKFFIQRPIENCKCVRLDFHGREQGISCDTCGKIVKDVKI